MGAHLIESKSGILPCCGIYYDFHDEDTEIIISLHK